MKMYDEGGLTREGFKHIKSVLVGDYTGVVLAEHGPWIELPPPSPSCDVLAYLFYCYHTKKWQLCQDDIDWRVHQYIEAWKAAMGSIHLHDCPKDGPNYTEVWLAAEKKYLEAQK